MRSLITIVENQSTADELLLSGQADLDGLVHMLPQVTDSGLFKTAIGKLKSQEQPLIAQEKAQLALAFISLLDSDPSTRQKIMLKMTGLTAVAVQPKQTASTNGPQS